MPQRIAIVDDEESVRIALGRLCGVHGLQARTFASAPELFEALTDGYLPDCVILDVHMPGMSGLDAQALLLERGFTIPVIVITGREDEQVRARVLSLGARAYLCKPVDSSELLRIINEHS